MHMRDGDRIGREHRDSSPIARCRVRVGAARVGRSVHTPDVHVLSLAHAIRSEQQQQQQVTYSLTSLLVATSERTRHVLTRSRSRRARVVPELELRENVGKCDSRDGGRPDFRRPLDERRPPRARPLRSRRLNAHCAQANAVNVSRSHRAHSSSGSRLSGARATASVRRGIYTNRWQAPPLAGRSCFPAAHR